jgi:hypothetical protein
MAKKSKEYIQGASASLRATISEIETVLAGNSLSPTGARLRAEMRGSIEDLAKKWFRRGFRRGCIEMHNNGKPRPKKIEYNASRDFYSGAKKPVTVKWKAK